MRPLRLSILSSVTGAETMLVRWRRANLIGALSVSTLPPNSPRPIFKPRETRFNDVTWWHVEAEWADGTIDEIGQFKSISEAWGWIARKSRAWTEDRLQVSPRQ